jgi:uncharacterized NAD-dependent epimerase/dehydratase family protein
MAKLILIDQGVEAQHDRLRACQLTGQTIFRRADGQFVHKDGVFHDVTGHGTACAGIIHRIAPEQAIHVVKLAAHNDLITEELLVEALRCCAGIEGATLVSLSMGIATNDPSPALRAACDQLQAAGIVVVAAVHNFPHLACYPAFFDSVLGVGCGLMTSKRTYGYLGPGTTNVLAKGTSQRVIWKDNSYKITAGTSFATAHFVGLLARLLAAHQPQNPAALAALLATHADPDVVELTYHKPATRLDNTTVLPPTEAHEAGRNLFTTTGQLPFLNKLALFPATEKEMNTVLEFRHTLPRPLTLAIDYPRFLNNRLQASRPLPTDVPVLKRDLLPHEYDAFDTLAVGYFLDVPVDTNILFATRLLSHCVRQNKHFVVLDAAARAFIERLIPLHNPAYTGQISLAGVTTELPCQLRRLGTLPPVRVPVLAVVGTGSRQGKLTVQLRLSHVLQQAGYRVAHVATEPQGLLLGAAFVFPYGHKGNVELEFTDWGYVLDGVFRGVQHHNAPDLIVTGIQGGILPRTKRLFEQHTGSILASMHYLLGVQPDAVICAINPTDTPDHIRQTLDTVQNFCKAAPIFCAMTPISRTVQQYGTNLYAESEQLTPAELQALMAQREAELGLPVLDVLAPASESRMLATIQAHFADNVPADTDALTAALP